jgi:hypothetical protein
MQGNDFPENLRAAPERRAQADTRSRRDQSAGPCALHEPSVQQPHPGRDRRRLMFMADEGIAALGRPASSRASFRSASRALSFAR